MQASHDLRTRAAVRAGIAAEDMNAARNFATNERAMADQLQDQTVDHAAVCRFDGSVSGIARPPGDATGRSVSSVCDQLRGDSGSHLLGNAVKFTERGVVRVRVLHLTGDKDVLQIRCEIEDTGTGIPPEIPGGDCREWHGSRGGVGAGRARTHIDGLPDASAGWLRRDGTNTGARACR